jgi:hypothetical protein
MIGFAGAFIVAFWNIYETNKRMDYYVKLQESNIRKYRDNVYGKAHDRDDKARPEIKA